MISKNSFKSDLILIRVLFSFCLISYSQAGWFTQSSGTTEHLESVYFINSMTGWAVGYSGIVLKTTNGGTNWIAYGGGTTNPLLSVYFVNSTQGWAVGGDADIIATGNGGLNWTLQSTGSTSVLNSVHFINAFSGWAVGGFMTIVKTTNGGSNWEPLLSGSVMLNSVYFTSVNTGFIAGHSGYVMKTTNAGLNWFVQNSNVDYSLYSIHFPPGSTTTGYTVGMGTPSPPILKSIDSGLNWAIQPVSPGDALTSVNFVDVSIGWAAGYMGTVMHTSNGGINWSYQLSGTSQSLRSICFINSNTGWAVGDLGTIIKTTNSGLTAIKPISNIIPEKFNLHQNYPNPFNPSTMISFDVSAYSFIKIIVYDAQGREVRLLVNEYLNPGTYEMPFNSSNLASGIYFYIMNSGSFLESKKMMLLK
jgi:photosystem II stability/assembly factor-like uncharacterized protein